MTISPTPPEPTRLLARTPEDIVAFAPVALGFTPATSAVMITVGQDQTFHARVDLPDDVDGAEEVVDALLGPAQRHEVRQVLFVVYDDDTAVADEVAWALHDGFTAAGIEVVDVLRVHDGHWFAVLPGRPRSAYAGTPFDTTSHPFVAQAVYEGKVVLGSREELRASLDPDPGAVAATEAALAGARPLSPAQVQRLVRHHTAAGTTCDPDELARLAVSLRDPALRDEAWGWVDRGWAREHLAFWRDAVRRVPEHTMPSVAAVLAFAAWLAGEGALAWCAVDRCREVQPGHSLARLVADMLTSAAPPRMWDQVRPGSGIHPTEPAA
ncbi:hypothetical protein DDE18_04960 [Nocardioides gansuensis]|uniref:DUF4192 domain-containing protein n=1 Tax=Nocardioides gansuensis TaxID=2138300 RepID=A0A2T8FD85_9ACTN|nr:DUF4192 domain-containing protein [Nocardioides gansuensis]PVG83678.1 hypothetical protein DDE18_04960 [Nocardioides gansuensis]